MPSQVAGVNVFVQDISNINKLNVSLKGAMIGEFEKGDDEEVQTVFDVPSFQEMYGSIEGAVDKKAYISAIQILQDAEALAIANVSNGASIGGLFLTDRGIFPFPVTGIPTKDPNSFDFKIPVADVIGTGTGNISNVQYVYDGQLNDTIIDSDVTHINLTFTFTISSVATPITVSGVKSGDYITFTNATYLVTSSVTPGALVNSFNLDTGTFNITFKNSPSSAPDLGTDIIINYRKDYGTYINDATIIDTSVTPNKDLIGDNNNNIVDFNGYVKDTPLVAGKCKLKIHPKSGSVVILTDIPNNNNDGSGTFTHTSLNSATINYSNGHIVLNFKDADTQITDEYITLSYKQIYYPLVALFARSKKAWSNNIGVAVEETNLATKEFKVVEYKKSGIIDTRGQVRKCGLGQTQVDGYGTPIFIESVFKNNSTAFYAIKNTDPTIDSTLLPMIDTVTYCKGGNNGIATTNTNRSNAISLYYEDTPNTYFNFFCSAGNITNITDINDLVTARKKFAFMDCIAGSSDALTTWAVTQNNIPDNMRLSFTAPNAYVTYNGNEWYCPVSALQLRQMAKRVKDGKSFMPPAGIGSTKGSVNVVRLERYYKKPEIKVLHEANINILKFDRNYGNVLFSDYTAQKYESATQAMNAVFTLNVMIENFERALQVIPFNIINQQTFLLLRNLIESYLNQLARFDGTIEPDYTLNIESINNNATKDEKVIYAELIFVFQSVAKEVTLTLKYTNNELYSEIAGA